MSINSKDLRNKLCIITLSKKKKNVCIINDLDLNSKRNIVYCDLDVAN